MVEPSARSHDAQSAAMQTDSRLEARVAALEIAQRIFATIPKIKNEPTSPPSKPPPKGLWDKLQIVSGFAGPVITGIVIFIVGFYIKDSIQLDLQARQLEINSAGQIQSALARLLKPADEETAKADGLMLAASGVQSLDLLVYFLESDLGSAQTGGEQGLRLLAATHKDETCEVFDGISKDERRNYLWTTHRTVMRLVGETHCDGALDILGRYDDRIPDTSDVTLQKISREMAKVFDVESLKKLCIELREARERHGAAAPRCLPATR